MQIPLQLAFEGFEGSDEVRVAIEHEIVQLEKHNHHITGARVSVIAPSHKHRTGSGYEIHIWLTIPPHENIVVTHGSSDDPRREHVGAAVKAAFAAARRQIDDLAQSS
jgi:hypothetical protein